MRKPRGNPKGLGWLESGGDHLTQIQTGCHRGRMNWGKHCSDSSVVFPYLFLEFSHHFVPLIYLFKESFLKMLYSWLVISSIWFILFVIDFCLLLFLSCLFSTLRFFSQLSSWMLYWYAIIFLLVNEFRAINHSVNTTCMISCKLW